MKPYVGKKVLEIGCGVGSMTSYIQQSSEVVCIDCLKQYVDFMGLESPGIKVFNYDIMYRNVMKLKEHNFDTIVCINVLEHIQKDSEALNNMRQLLKKKGRLVLVVPAHRFLYGPMDVEVDHFRRYDKKELVDKIRLAGFGIEKVTHFNRIGVLGWFLNNKILRRKHISVLQMMLFNKYVPIINKLDSLVNIPLGQSIIAVGKKI